VRDRCQTSEAGPLRGVVVAFGISAMVALSGCGGVDDHATVRTDAGSSSTPRVIADPWGRSSRVVHRAMRLVSLPAPGRPDLDRCLAEAAQFTRRGDAVIEQDSGFGSAITVPLQGGYFACDRLGTLRAPAMPWCGFSYGKTFQGVLRDPRLQLAGCEDGRGRPIAFLWVTPPADARWVAVDQGQAVDVLAVPSGGVPVRISTRRFDPLKAMVRLRVAFLDGSGLPLSRRTVVARVAG